MSRTILFDASGAVTDDVALARTAEIVTEDALGREVRSYGTVGDVEAASEVGDPDQVEDETTDGPKATWDVYVQADGEYRLAETLEDLGSVLEFALLPIAGQREALANLMTLPVWDSMPGGLRGEVTGFLERTRPA